MTKGSLDEYIKKGGFYEAVVVDGADIIMIVDYEGNIRYHNPSVEDTLGYKSGELIGRNFIELNHPLYQKSLEEIFKNLKTEQYAYNIEFYFKKKDGDYTYLEFNSINLHHKDKIDGLILDCRDIAQRKKDAEELVKAQKAKELFLANMSHEIRTPISGIAGMISLLEKFDINPEGKKYINAIKHSADHLKIIINDILDFAAIEAGKLSFEHIGFKPAEQIEIVVNSFELNAKEKGLSIELIVDANPELILLGDPVRLNQVLVNLINNAVKFTPSGTITVSMKIIEEDNKNAIVRFSVKDTGIGIPEDKKKNIFESFSQADATINRRFGGTGLGLAISKHIVEVQGGKITLESRLNQGSEFTFEIPFEKGVEADLPDKAAENAIEPIQLTGIKVLLVEDNDINRLYASKVLQELGCRVETAENGQEAIDKLKESNFEIILMDLQMPILDGFEATKIIRTEFPDARRNVPIIALTANAIKGDNEKCLEVGMNDYLSKPFTSEKLRNKIFASLKNSKSAAGSNIPNVDRVAIQNGINYDLSYLKELCNNDEAFIKEMVTTFVSTTPKVLTQIEESLAINDYQQISKIAHKLKPSVSFMGINKVQQSVIQIESIKGDPLPERYSQLIRQFVGDIRKAVTDLSRLYQQED